MSVRNGPHATGNRSRASAYPHAKNNASDATTVTQLPDLTIAKSHAGNFTQGQTGAAYTITASNVGSGPTSGTVTVTDVDTGELVGQATAS